ncbi:unnamed protein product [Blepharisma stoltei]|uniref:Transmembrane protein n=1 Tax=Blepharisma stoltei TaxID=1481888 RepID=A0AAU9IGJ0_9CILI|nr:unnamed protein product [Blepharisma stoltei]
MKLLFILISSTFAYDITSERDGQIFGYVTLYSMIPLFALMLLLVFLFHSHSSELLGGFTQLATFMQFARFVPLINFSNSVFYRSFWKQIYYFYQGYVYFISSEVEPNQPHFEDMGIKSVLVLYNAQEYLVVFLLCFLAFAVVPWIRPRQTSKGRFSILMWFIIASCLDLIFFCILAVQNADSTSFLIILSAAISGVYLSLMIMYFMLLLYSLFTNSYLEYFNFCIREFKDTSRIYWLYYPLFISARTLFAILLVFAYQYEFYQCICMISAEAIIVLYLIAFQPYKSFRNTFFTILYHSFEASFLVIPILYDKSVWTISNLNILNLALCSASLFLIILRFSLDLIFIHDTKNDHHISPSESSGNMTVTEQRNANDSTINNSFEGLEYQRKHVRKLSGNKPMTYLDPNNANEFSMHSRNNSGEARMYFPSQRASFNYREPPTIKNPKPAAEKDYLQIPSSIVTPTESKNLSLKTKQILPNHKAKNSKIFNLNNLTVKN